MKRPVLPLLLLLALPLLPAPAAADTAAGTAADDVVVTAAVRTVDGGLVFRSRPATSEAAGRALAARWDAERGVAAADVEHRVRATATDPHRRLQWGLTRLRAETSWTTATGTGQVVAVVDSGVQGDHPDLAGQVLPPIDILDPSATTTVATDPEGHGTHVAGVVAALTGNGVGVAGLAHGAKVLPVRVLDELGEGTDGDVAKGIVRAVDAGADVVNLSLGGPRPSALLQEAVAYALARGAVVVAASGNDGPGRPVQYPAATPGVIAVGAVDDQDIVAGFSSTGPHIAVVAPGVRVASTLNLSQYAYDSGTSMAAPFVAAAAAQLLQAGVAGRDVRARLIATAQDLGPAGRDDAYGAGLLDVVAALAPPSTAPSGSDAGSGPGAVSAPATAPPVAPEPIVPAPVAPAPAPVAPAPAPAPPGPAPAAQPAPAAVVEPGPLVLRLSASAAVVDAGSDVALRARALRDSRAASDAVVLERRTAAGWAVVRSGTPDADGRVGWTLRLDRGGELRVRSGGSVSAVVPVRVRSTVTASVGRGAVSGVVRPGGRGTVVLERLRAGRWTAVARTTADLRYRFSVRLPRGTVVRVAVPARPGLLAATSRSVRL